MYQALSELDNIQLFFNTANAELLNIFLAIVMYGVALGIKPHLFKSALDSPKPLAVGLVCQWFVLPVLTFGLVLLFRFHIPSQVALGLILVASCSGGISSNFMVQYGKGNVELSILMTSITTIGTPIFTPLNFALWGGLYVKYFNRLGLASYQPLQVSLGSTVLMVLFVIFLPLVLGWLTNKTAPRFSERLKPVMRYLSIALFLATMLVMLINNFQVFAKYIKYMLLIVFVHNLLAFCIGYLASIMFKLPVKDLRTVTLDNGIRNSGLALTLLNNPKVFPTGAGVVNGGMMFVTALWGVWHLLAGFILAVCLRLLKFDTLDLRRKKRSI